MRDPHPRPSGLAVAAHPGRRGLLLDLLARLLAPARDGFGAGHAVRRRQEANPGAAGMPSVPGSRKGRQRP